MRNLGSFPSNTALMNFNTAVNTPRPATGFDKFFNTLTKVGNTVQKGSEIVGTVKGTIATVRPGAPQPAQPNFINQPGAPPAPENRGLSTGAKVGIAVAAVALVSGGIYLATRPKKKALGELNTAKTKKGKALQRAAVFAKLDEAGDTYPKNKNGKRKPKRKR